jgi:hypothetical membrane protein
MKTQKLFSLFGLVGVISYVLFYLIASVQFPGYSHASLYISDLGAVGEPSASLMNIGFISTGILFIFFAWSTLNAFKNDWKGTVGGILLIIEGIAEMLSGIFQCDPGCNATNPTMAETIHNIVGPFTFILTTLAIFFWAFRFRNQRGWSQIWIYSLVSGIAGVILFLVFGMSVGTPVVGIWQRLLQITLFIWIAVFSYQLYKKWDQGPFTK